MFIRNLVENSSDQTKGTVQRGHPYWGCKLTRFALASVLSVSLMSVIGNDASPQELPIYPGYPGNPVANDAAQLANSVYDLKTPHGDRYEMTPRTGPDGFQAAVYKDRWTGRTYVVYAGTQLTDPGDLRTDRGIVQSELNITTDSALNSQIRQAQGFFKDATRGVNKSGVVVVGHSLGGHLAQIVGAENQVTTHTFNAPGVPESTLKRYGIEVRSSLDIVNHVRASDPAGAFGDHLGQTVTYRDARVPIGINGQYRPAGLLDNHSIVPFSSDLPAMEGSITTNQELENGRAERTQDTGYIEGRNDWINPDGQAPGKNDAPITSPDQVPIEVVVVDSEGHVSQEGNPSAGLSSEAPVSQSESAMEGNPGEQHRMETKTQAGDPQPEPTVSPEPTNEPANPEATADEPNLGGNGGRGSETPNAPQSESTQEVKDDGGFKEIVPDENLEGSGFVEIEGDPDYAENGSDNKGPSSPTDNDPNTRNAPQQDVNGTPEATPDFSDPRLDQANAGAGASEGGQNQPPYDPHVGGNASGGREDILASDSGLGNLLRDERSVDPLDEFLKSLDGSAPDQQVNDYLTGLQPAISDMRGPLDNKYNRIDEERHARLDRVRKEFEPIKSQFASSMMSSLQNELTNIGMNGFSSSSGCAGFQQAAERIANSTIGNGASNAREGTMKVRNLYNNLANLYERNPQCAPAGASQQLREAARGAGGTLGGMTDPSRSMSGRQCRRVPKYRTIDLGCTDAERCFKSQLIGYEMQCR